MAQSKHCSLQCRMPAFGGKEADIITSMILLIGSDDPRNK
jgi:hypothetical protein